MYNFLIQLYFHEILIYISFLHFVYCFTCAKQLCCVNRLNIGPGPDGDWDTTAYSRLKEIGAWMKVNSEGIYDSKPIAPYSSGNIFFTQSDDEKNIYAFYLSDKDDVILPAEININQLTINAKSNIVLLGSKEKIKWNQAGSDVIITVPSSLQNKSTGKQAVVFKIASK